MGADPVDEAAIIAWVDGELTGAEAARVEAAVANDADWRALADRHRRMKARFAAAFDPLARPPAEVISLADVRARRAAKAAPAPSHGWRRWAAGGAIAASLVVGLFVLQDRGGAPGGGVPAPVAVALNDQLSGDAGRCGSLCRSVTGTGNIAAASRGKRCPGSPAARARTGRCATPRPDRRPPPIIAWRGPTAPGRRRSWA